MLHHEESPEKPQYNVAPPISRQPPPILPNLPFSSKNFQTPPFPSILKKSTPPLYEGGAGGAELCLRSVAKKSWQNAHCFIYPPLIFTNQSLTISQQQHIESCISLLSHSL